MIKFDSPAVSCEGVSPRLQVRFAWQEGEELVLYRPDGQRFLSSVELEERLVREQQRAERLRELGIDPEQI